MTTPPDTHSAGTDADSLRASYVADMAASGDFATDAIRDAFAAVRRERFLPEVDLNQVYQRKDSVITKRSPDGTPLSSVSAAWVQATQLAQADIKPGMSVLEIGSGGSNAALLAELVGPTGHVTTMDIDPWVIDRARRFLASDYPQVTVLQADAENGVPDADPWDRIIVTVDAPDIPPAWIHLVEGGRLVVPLTIHGLTWSLGFEWDGTRLAGTQRKLMGFVEMQGLGAHGARHLPLVQDHSVELLVDDDPSQIDLSGLQTAFVGRRVDFETGVQIGAVEPFDDLELWLMSQTDTLALLRADKPAIESGLVEKSATRGAKTIVAGDSLAYRSSKGITPDRSVNEFTIVGYGPNAERLGSTYVELIQQWDSQYRDRHNPTVLVYPRSTPDDQLPPGRVIAKRHTKILISWPALP